MENRIQEDQGFAINSQDGQILGDKRSMNSITWEIFRVRSEASVLTFSKPQFGQFFPTSPNHNFIILPSIVKAGPGNWQATNLRVLPLTSPIMPTINQQRAVNPCPRYFIGRSYATWRKGIATSDRGGYPAFEIS